MTHLVETAYADHIRPILLQRVAQEQALNPHHLGTIADTDAFRIRQRQCLFLGLSDGARIDSFRRANRELDHEQIWQTHDLSAPRVKELVEKLTIQIRKLQKGAKSLGVLLVGYELKTADSLQIGIAHIECQRYDMPDSVVPNPEPVGLWLAGECYG